MVVAAPTASGKTLIAEMAALEAIRKGGKAVYIVPLRALASEKYREFREKYEPIGVRVGISAGDMDSSDPWLSRYDLIIVTSEKLDSLLRHGIPWSREISLVIVDEVHLLDDPSRGPTLEVVLTRLRQASSPKVLALSATISNHDEIAAWLNASAVKSDWRPVELLRGVCYDNKVNFFPGGEIILDPDEASLKELLEQAVSRGKQALVFISTRRNAEAAAEKISGFIGKKLSAEEKAELEKVSSRVLRALGHRTLQCERLAGCIRNGAGFHHAGLAAKQRALVEEYFRMGTIKVITATPTLAAGINLPAWRVIIRDMRRFDSRRGMDYLPILEVQQMMGRAGRPSYDTEGQAIILAANQADARFAWENYIKGEPERVYSKLGVEPLLRTHVLALVASGVAPSRKSLLEFFSKTFYAHQYKDQAGISAIIDRIISQLEDFRFIRTSLSREESGPFISAAELSRDISLEPTPIGRRVSELYIDPVTANAFIRGLDKASRQKPDYFGYLHLMSQTIEMSPALSVRKQDIEMVNDLINREEKSLLTAPPNPWEIEYDDYVRAVKTAAFFEDWMDEAGEDAILERFRVTPGEITVRLNNADWLIYSMQELGLLMGHKEILRDLRRLRLRVKHGIREELMPLVKLRGIGRVRARKLFGSGLRTLNDLRKVPEPSLERVIGAKVARKIKEQL
jgi:helicase